jgi:hypothetical protein
MWSESFLRVRLLICKPIACLKSVMFVGSCSCQSPRCAFALIPAPLLGCICQESSSYTRRLWIKQKSKLRIRRCVPSPNLEYIFSHSFCRSTPVRWQIQRTSVVSYLHAINRHITCTVMTYRASTQKFKFIRLRGVTNSQMLRSSTYPKAKK